MPKLYQNPTARKWNWGAFLLTWMWGLGNNTYVGLSIFPVAIGCLFFFLTMPSLYLYPLSFFIVFAIFLRVLHGLEGYQLAWKNKNWQSLGHFLQVQRKWAIAGVVINLLLLCLLIFLVTGFIHFINQYRYPVRDQQTQAQQSEEYRQALIRANTPVIEIKTAPNA